MPSATASSLCRHPADAGCGPNVDSAMSAATAVMIARFVMIPIVCLDPFSRSHRRVIAQCTPGTWRACVEHGLYFCNVDQQPFRNDGYTNIHKLIRHGVSPLASRPVLARSQQRNMRLVVAELIATVCSNQHGSRRARNHAPSRSGAARQCPIPRCRFPPRKMSGVSSSNYIGQCAISSVTTSQCLRLPPHGSASPRERFVFLQPCPCEADVGLREFMANR